MYKILSEPVPRIEQFAPQVPPDVAALLHRALESDRARRWPSMREFLYATLQCESLAPAVGEVDLATRHHASLPRVKGGADAFAKTMGVGGPDQSGGWNPARTAPFLLTPGGPGMKREIDAAIETMRRRGGADVQQQPSMAVAGRESLASTTPGHAAPGAIVAAKPSLGSTIPGPAALQAANVNVSAGANVTTGRDSEISEPQMSGEVPAAHEEAFSLGPSSLVPGSTMTPPPSELDAGAPSGSKGLPWLPILAITVLVSGAGTFAYMKMRGSHEVAPSPTVAVTTDAATAQSAADASAIADANANAAALTADAGATTPTAQDAAVAQPSTNPAPDTHPATNAGTPTTTTTPRRTTTHTSGSTHHAHSSGSGGSGLNIIDPAALQHAEQQEGH